MPSGDDGRPRRTLGGAAGRPGGLLPRRVRGAPARAQRDPVVLPGHGRPASPGPLAPRRQALPAEAKRHPPGSTSTTAGEAEAEAEAVAAVHPEEEEEELPIEEDIPDDSPPGPAGGGGSGGGPGAPGSGAAAEEEEELMYGGSSGIGAPVAGGAYPAAAPALHPPEAGGPGYRQLLAEEYMDMVSRFDRAGGHHRESGGGLPGYGPRGVSRGSSQWESSQCVDGEDSHHSLLCVGSYASDGEDYAPTSSDFSRRLGLEEDLLDEHDPHHLQPLQRVPSLVSSLGSYYSEDEEYGTDDGAYLHGDAEELYGDLGHQYGEAADPYALSGPRKHHPADVGPLGPEDTFAHFGYRERHGHQFWGEENKRYSLHKSHIPVHSSIPACGILYTSRDADLMLHHGTTFPVKSYSISAAIRLREKRKKCAPEHIQRYVLSDADFISSLLEELPGVDPCHESIRAALSDLSPTREYP